MALNSTQEEWQFSDKSRQLITSETRVRMLVERGFLFEACATQAAVVEALLFFSVLTVAVHERKPAEIRKNLSRQTLGGLIMRAQKYGLLDSDLLEELIDYKNERNFLVHHHLTELHNFDYNVSLDKGEAILAHLLKLTRDKTYKMLKAAGHKDAEKFRD